MKIQMAKLVKVLIFTAVCIGFTVLLGVKLANQKLFSENYTLGAHFENAQGVLAGDMVKIAGVDVGRVTKTEIKGDLAYVEFEVEQGIQLPQDTEVAIRWRNVVGQRFLYLYPGDSDSLLKEGNTIPVEQTKDIADIGQFLNRVGPILKAIDPEKANEFVDAMNVALSSNEQNVRDLIDSGAVLAKELGESDDDIRGLLSSADTIMAAYASQDESLASFIDDLDSVSGVLARRTDDINALVTNFAEVQQQLERLLTNNRENIDGTIAGLKTVADVLDKNQKNLVRTVETLPLGVAGYFQTTSWGEWFNVRVVYVSVKDQDSKVIVEQFEHDSQHGDDGGDPGSTPCKDCGTSSEGSQGQSPSREGVESILRFVLTGDGDE
jgi:phospholipid/cholesterol/gamma-HCH transport system substrate-binding protein